MTRKELKIVLIVLLVGICGNLGIDIYLASMPHIMTYLHTDKQHMQQSVSIFLLGLSTSILFYGPLSDKYGRKPIVFLGLSIACFASIACVFTHSIYAFLSLRLLQGIGSGVSLGLARTIIVDVIQGDRLISLISYFAMIVMLSPLLAPTIGSYIQHYLGWQANFITLAAIILIALLTYAFFCPETNMHKNPHAIKIGTLFRTYGSFLIHRKFIAFTLISGTTFSINMAYATTSAFILQQQFHLSPIIYGWVTLIAGFGNFINRPCVPLFIRYIGPIKTMLSGFFIALGSGVWILVFSALHLINVPLMMIAVFCASFSLGMMGPTTTSNALSEFHQKRGAAGALYGSFQMLAGFISSSIASAISSEGVKVLGFAYAILSLIALSSYYLLVAKKTSRSAKDGPSADR